MIQCPRCHGENPPQAKFCLECATPLALRCSSCGTQLPRAAKFCFECAQPVSRATTPLASRFSAPDAYTPRHLADRILTSKAALEGERKQVTVLFADVKSSMELLADRDPEEARKLLDPVLERMIDGVHRYEGTVNQVMGDGIMALFGAPLAHEDHAVRACYAALRMHEAVGRHAEELRRTQGLDVQIRVGLNSGEVVVRSIGSDLHMDYTAVGQTTHLAARMEQLARPGTTFVTADTLRLAEGYVEVRPLGPVPVKGIAEPLELYEVTGAGAVRTRLQAAAARGLTRFVGRDAEVEQLRKTLEHAGAGHGQLVAVVGEPGVGKSRLFYEFARSHRTRDWLVLSAGSVSYGKATSYLPVIDLLKAYFKVHDRETDRDIREKVTGKLLTLDRSLESVLPALLALLDVPMDDHSWQALDPEQRRRRTLDAVKGLLLRETQRQPLLVAFEDLHWIDSETQALLDALVGALPGARFLLLVNYRPEYQHGWGSKSYYTQLRLDTLASDTAEELLDTLLGMDSSVDPLKPLLIGRTAGNPLFLEESVRALVETASLTGDRGAYRLASPVEAIDVPATVQAILASRIDRLTPEHKHLLQTASVIGTNVSFALLAAVADVGDEDLQGGLAHLQAAEFLYETSLFPDPEYTFKHALTHDVAYGSLLQERRRALHARIVGAIEDLHAGRLTEQVERLADHAFKAEEWTSAAVYLRQAGTKAVTRSAHREAAACFDHALAALSHLPETRETIELGVDVRLDLRSAFFPLGGLEGIGEHLREAERLARMLDDPRRLGWVSAQRANYLWQTGHPIEARAPAEHAYALAQRLGDLPLRAAASFFLSEVCVSAGDYRRAEALCEEITRSPESATVGAAWPLWWVLAWASTERGRFAEAMAHGEEGLRRAEAAHHEFIRIITSCGIAEVHARRGQLAEALRMGERARALAIDADLPGVAPIVARCLGHVYALSGRIVEGRALLDEALQGAERLGRRAVLSRLLTYLGEASLLAEQPDEAFLWAERALALTRERGERGHEAWALRLLGDIARHRDAHVLAEAHYREAAALATELGMLPLLAHCHLGLGTVYGRMDRRQQAVGDLATASRMYGEMGMRSWQQRASAELATMQSGSRDRA